MCDSRYKAYKICTKITLKIQSELNLCLLELVQSKQYMYKLYDFKCWYKLEFPFRNVTSGNVRHWKSIPKTPTVGADSDNSAHPSTSSSSGRELLDAPKPEVKYCRNKKGDFENKIFDWIMAEASTTKSPEPEKVLDDIDRGLGSITVMIRRDLNVRDRT